ncbi:MAG: AmmeMemoRadiSam system protein B [Acidobacteriota bacterium]
MERSPVVAGHFYPAQPDALRALVDEYMRGDPGQEAAKAVALVVPHAGYVYSGRTAGKTYGSVQVPGRVVLLGPNHTGRGRPAALWAKGGWRTPLGRVPVDERFAAALLGKTPGLETDQRAHLEEHSLEVQLPFLQRRAPGLRIVPICLADLGLERLVALGESLGAVIQAHAPGETLVVISSDMTHYESREAARQKDRLALERMEALDGPGLYATVRENSISMCGVVPAVVGCIAAVRLGAVRGRLCDYSCSGDVTGDVRQVVAYAGLTCT